MGRGMCRLGKENSLSAEKISGRESTFRVSKAITVVLLYLLLFYATNRSVYY